MKLVALILLLFFTSCSSTPTLPYHVPVRAELPNNASAKVAFSNGARVRGSQNDRASPLDKTPYRANSNILSFLVQKRLLPWSSFRVEAGASRPFAAGISFLPYGSSGSDFRFLIESDMGIYFAPTSVAAKQIEGQPQKLRKGILSGWTWSVVAALGYRVSSFWLITAGARRQAFNIHHKFTAGIEEEWTLRGDQVVVFLDQGFDFGAWRLDASIFQDGMRFNSDPRSKKIAFALAGGIAW